MWNHSKIKDNGNLMKTKFNLKDCMEVLMINEKLSFYAILELFIRGKLNRIYYFNVYTIQ